LSPPEAEAIRRRYTQNPEAYDAYLRGWALVQTFHHSARPEKLEAARKHFEQALAFDPDYTLALAGLSGVEIYYHYFKVERTPDHFQRAEELARRALALDPQLSEAHVALGDVYGARDDFVAAADEYRQAVRLDPRNAYAWEELAWALNYQQPPDPEEAEKAARKAIRLQPGWFWPHFQLAWALRFELRYEEAIAAFEHTLQLNPAFRAAHLGLGEVYLAEGNYNQALAQFNKARRMGETPSLLVQISAVYAALGDKEKSLAELENAVSGGYSDFDHLDSSHNFESLRGDPRFQDLLRRVGPPTD
jgi:tetratricopeptide (TPR) repeat protein